MRVPPRSRCQNDVNGWWGLPTVLVHLLPRHRREKSRDFQSTKKSLPLYIGCLFLIQSSIHNVKSSLESFEVVDVFACGHTATACSPGNLPYDDS